jgi:hypothetical protein
VHVETNKSKDLEKRCEEGIPTSGSEFKGGDKKFKFDFEKVMNQRGIDLQRK